MSFLAPLFLFGVLAVCVPVLLHLRRRKSQQRFAFPSLMFLEEVPHATIRRRRIRDLPLLVLRALAVLLLALAFAQPTLKGLGAGGGEGAKAVFLLVDRSASMTIGERWQRAEEFVKKRLEGLSDADRVTLALFDQTVEVPVQSTGDPSLVEDALRATSPRDRSTSLSAGLHALRPMMLEKLLKTEEAGGPQSVELVVVSDFPKNGVLDIENLRLPVGVNLVLHSVSETSVSRTSASEASVSRESLAKESGSSASGELSDGGLGRANRWVQSVELDRGLGTGRGRREQVRLTAVLGLDLPESLEPEVPNATPGTGAILPEVEVSLWLDGRQVETQRVRLAGRATPVVFKAISLDSERTVKGEVRLGKDVFALDDVFFFTASAADVLSVGLGVGRDRESGVYVQEALESSRSPRYRVLDMTADEITRAGLSDARAVVVTDAGALSSSSLAELERFVQEGGGLLTAYGREAIGNSLPGWIEMRVDTKVRQSREGMHLGHLDENHQVFASIRDADWGVAPFFRMFELLAEESGGRGASLQTSEERAQETLPMARFSDGSIAMTERRVGLGRVIGFASTLDAAWSDFPRHGVFLAWVDQVVGYLVALTPAQPFYMVGEPNLVSLPDDQAGEWIMVEPGGGTTNIRPGDGVSGANQPNDRARDRSLLLTFEEAGHSSLRLLGAGEGQGSWYAANLDRSESELESADLDVLKAKLVAATPSTVGASDRQQSGGPPRSFWWLVLYAALLLLISEGVLANRNRSAAMQPLPHTG